MILGFEQVCDAVETSCDDIDQCVLLASQLDTSHRAVSGRSFTALTSISTLVNYRCIAIVPQLAVVGSSGLKWWQICYADIDSYISLSSVHCTRPTSTPCSTKTATR